MKKINTRNVQKNISSLIAAALTLVLFGCSKHVPEPTSASTAPRAPAVQAEAEVKLCPDQAPLRTFSIDTAMEATYCSYNKEHEGTLLPLENTAQWDKESSEHLVEPLVATTYVENGIESAVLVTATEKLENGKLSGAHASGAELSIYVFRKTSDHWSYFTGAKNVFERGSFGGPPDRVQLVKLGNEKFGLAISLEGRGQGYTESRIEVVALSEPSLPSMGIFDTGLDNKGICSNDPKKREEAGLQECQEYTGIVDLFAQTKSTYYGVRVKYSGTTNDKEDFKKIVLKDNVVCYHLVANRYVEIDDASCKTMTPIPNSAIAQ